MDLQRVSNPVADVLTLADAKLQLRIEPDDTEQDDLIQALIDAATAMLDGHAGVLGRALVSQQWKVRYDYGFPGWRFPLPLSDLISVDLVRYADSSTGVMTTLASSEYTALDGPACALQPAFGKAWPAPRSQARAVEITFTAGYGDTGADVPAPLRAAMKLLIAHLFEHREAVVGVDNRDSSAELPMGVTALIAPYRVRSAA